MSIEATHAPTLAGNLRKFRPVLTLQQLTRIASLVSQSTTPIDIEIKRICVPLIAKIEVGAINPAYKLSAIYAAKQEETSERQRYENDMMSPAEMEAYENKILGV
jgi:predicted transcriptional regulator